LPTKQAVRARRLLTAALVTTTIGLFVATGMLYLTQSNQRQLLASTVRTTGWVAYQAEFEYVKAIAALDVALADPSPSAIETLRLRLELLASRLPSLYASQEGWRLPGMSHAAPFLRKYKVRIGRSIEQFGKLPQETAAHAAALSKLRAELAPLGTELQQLAESAAARNDAVVRGERHLAETSATVPLLLMFVSGAGLVALLGVQAGRDRRRLNETLAARRQQQATESNFRAAIQAMPGAILIFDPSTDDISFVNSAAATLVAPHSDPEWRRLIRAVQEASRATQGDDARSVNIPFERPGGEIMSLRGSLCSIVWEGKHRQLLALADISKTRDAELQVMQAAKLAMLGEMATAIAHETNQPLAVIKMAVANAQRLVTNDADKDAVSAKLIRISDQVDRIKRITDQVRRYGRMTSRQEEPFDLHDAIGLAIGFVAEQYRAAGIRLKIDVDLPPALAVAGEQTMFEQVIVNLLVNARDAFECERESAIPPQVIVHAATAGDNVVISVTDNAGGIRPDMLSKVFEPFTTTKPTGKGTGLGLSMSRSIVRDMRGDIEATNEDAGAMFIIRLPIAGAGLARHQAA
jgi:C4-dicarboxylate-specific signal transduction histidine kinase